MCPSLWKTREDLERLQAEILILIRGNDRWDEMQWSTKFAPAFEVAKEGHLILDLGKMSTTIDS